MISALVALLFLWALIRLSRKPLFLLTVGFLCASRAAWIMYHNHGTSRTVAPASNKAQNLSRKRVTNKKRSQRARNSQRLRLISP